VPAVVTEHAYVERRCPCCGYRAVPAPGLAGVVCGQRRLRIGLVNLIATLQRDLGTPHGLELSAGAIVGAAAAARGRPAVERTRGAIRASPAVHADETGWRAAGRNGYAWTFSTPTHRFFVRGGRDKGALDSVLGDGIAGVLVGDFYCAYTNYEGRHQYCWAHLLRDVHELTQQHRTSPSAQGWARLVHRLDTRAGALADPDPRARRRAQQGFERELLTLCRPYLDEAGAPQASLCRRVERHLPALFVFVADPAMPPTNNATERSLRHLVTRRKVSGGTRGPAGTDTKMTPASLCGTWRAKPQPSGRAPPPPCRPSSLNSYRPKRFRRTRRPIDPSPPLCRALAPAELALQLIGSDVHQQRRAVGADGGGTGVAELLDEGAHRRLGERLAAADGGPAGELDQQAVAPALAFAGEVVAQGQQRRQKLVRLAQPSQRIESAGRQDAG
jgi:hypothetical protein